MNKSDSIGELAAALAAAQAEFQAVKKDKENPFFKSSYADLPAVVLAASPILSKHGLAVSQFPDFDGANDLLTTVLMHSSGEWIESTMRLYLSKADPQGQGSAMTYGRRYAYSGSVGIVTETDDDGQAGSKQRSQSKERAQAPRGARSTAPAKHPPAGSLDASADRAPADDEPSTDAKGYAPPEPEDERATAHMPTKWRNEMLKRLAHAGIAGDDAVALVLHFATNRTKVISGVRPEEAESVVDAVESIESGVLAIRDGEITNLAAAS